MGNHRVQFDHPPRNLLREANQHKDNKFMPSLAIRRAVVMEPAEAKAIRRAIRRNLKAVLPRERVKGYDIVNPTDWSLTLIENKKLINQLRQADARPSSKDMMALAGLLQVMLLRQLRGSPEQLPLPLGDLDRFGKGSPKKAVGVTPLGWRGPRARYTTLAESEASQPLGVLVAENLVCIDALSGAKTLKLSEAAARSTLSRTPHITVVKNMNGIRDHEFDLIEPAIQAALPDEISLADPVIYVRPRIGFRRPLETALRMPESDWPDIQAA